MPSSLHGPRLQHLHQSVGTASVDICLCLSPISARAVSFRGSFEPDARKHYVGFDQAKNANHVENPSMPSTVMLAPQHLLDVCRYASTCQTVGMNIGYFTSFTVFLALNDVDFCNKYLRSGDHQPQGVLPLGTYLRFWGWFYAVLTVLIAAFKSEVNFRPSGTESAP